MVPPKDKEKCGAFYLRVQRENCGKSMSRYCPGLAHSQGESKWLRRDSYLKLHLRDDVYSR